MESKSIHLLKGDKGQCPHDFGGDKYFLNSYQNYETKIYCFYSFKVTNNKEKTSLRMRLPWHYIYPRKTHIRIMQITSLNH